MNGKRVSDKTIALEQTHCDEAVALLSNNPPTTAYKLIDQTIQSGGWGDKPRARQQCVGAINRLLTFAVSHEGLAMDWILPQHQKLTLAGNGKPLEGKKEIATLSDLQILELLDSVPTQEWRNLLLVMAVYGLRPEEVMHLTLVNHHREAAAVVQLLQSRRRAQHQDRNQAALAPGHPAQWSRWNGAPERPGAGAGWRVVPIPTAG